MSSAKNTTIHPQIGRLSPAEHVLFSLISAHGFIVKSTWQYLSNGSNEVEETMASAMWSLTRRGLVVARTFHFRN